MTDPFCPDCGGTGITRVGGIEQEICDDRDDGSVEVPCETCKNDEEYSNLADEVLEN
tara:strand:+ start:572 stop:742 length:171 start_codon:yes stop_codon:yes gene_type:complete